MDAPESFSFAGFHPVVASCSGIPPVKPCQACSAGRIGRQRKEPHHCGSDITGVSSCSLTEPPEFFRFGEDHDGTEEIAVDFNAEAPALYLGEGLHNGQPQPGADFMPGFVAPDEAFRDFFCGEVQGSGGGVLTLTT